MRYSGSSMNAKNTEPGARSLLILRLPDQRSADRGLNEVRFVRRVVDHRGVGVGVGRAGLDDDDEVIALRDHRKERLNRGVNESAGADWDSRHGQVAARHSLNGQREERVVLAEV